MIAGLNAIAAGHLKKAASAGTPSTEILTEERLMSDIKWNLGPDDLDVIVEFDFTPGLLGLRDETGRQAEPDEPPLISITSVYEAETGDEVAEYLKDDLRKQMVNGWEIWDVMIEEGNRE